MAGEFFVKRGQKIVGSFSLKKIQHMLAQQKLKANDFVRIGKGGEWTRLSEVHREIRSGTVSVDRPVISYRVKRSFLRRIVCHAECPHCQSELRIDEKSIGNVDQCPSCRGTFVPSPRPLKKFQRQEVTAREEKEKRKSEFEDWVEDQGYHIDELSAEELQELRTKFGTGGLFVDWLSKQDIEIGELSDEELTRLNDRYIGEQMRGSTETGGVVDFAVQAGIALIMVLLLGYPVFWVLSSLASEFDMPIGLPVGISWAGVCFWGGLVIALFPFAFFAAAIPALPIVIILLLVIANNTSDGEISELIGKLAAGCVIAGGALMVLSGPVWIIEGIVGLFS